MAGITFSEDLFQQCRMNQNESSKIMEGVVTAERRCWYSGSMTIKSLNVLNRYGQGCIS